jgi:hypothetical protein
MKKVIFVFVFAALSILLAACSSASSLTDFNLWGKVTDQPILEEGCGGFTEWTGLAAEVDQDYDLTLVDANKSMVVTATITPTVEVDGYTIILVPDNNEENFVTTNKFIVSKGINLISAGTERNTIIKKAVEKMDNITSVIFTFKASSTFLNFGRITVDKNSIDCMPQSVK